MQTRKLQLQRPTPAVGVVSSAARADRLAQVATRDSAKSEDLVSQLVKLLREYVRTPLPRPGDKAGNYE
jgi:hypothetical protein